MAKAYGIKGKNAEQDEALKHLLDCSVDLVILDAVAGSGKTILALAAGLEQVIESRTYKEVMFTRAPVAVGDDLGFLPGTVDEKLLPWCMAVLDNLEVLGLDEKDAARYLRFAAMQHMRGRSLNNRYVIIDEAQNMSVQQIKVLLTRAGENTKVVVLGDSSQIDNRKLTVDNNALAVMSKLAGSVDFVKVVKLPTGVRSRLCNWVTEVL